MHSKYLQIAAAMAQMDGALRLDANESAVLARELEHIEAQVTMTLYPELRGREYVPMIAGVDPGAETFTWRRFDLRGYADLIGNGAKDLPSVDIDLSENYRPIRSFGNQYGYTVQDLRNFALAKARGSSISLDNSLAQAARMFIDRKGDDMIALGDSRVTSLTGFLNDSNVPVLTTATLFGSWATSTPDQILADMFAIEKKVIEQSVDIIQPDSMILPVSQYGIVATTRLGTTTDTTILQFFLKNSQAVKQVGKWNKLAAAGSGGVDRAVCYKRDPLIAGCIYPIIFQAQSPERRGFRWSIPCEGRSGGTVVRMPLGMVYADGI